MVTEESLKGQYVNMSTDDLLGIAKDKVGYTELANSVAMDELKRRKVPVEEINSYEPTARKIDEATKENCLVDLEFSKKVLYFYLMWFPRARRFYKPYHKRDGYILKSDQSNYYSITGFASLVIACIVANKFNEDPLIPVLATWTALFFLFYSFDISYNRERQMKNIQQAIDSEEVPWDFNELNN